MGQKINPIGLRLRINKNWDSNWYEDKNFGKFLSEDIKIRKFVDTFLKHAKVSKTVIERSSSKKVVVNLYVAKSGLLINSKKITLDDVRKQVEKITNSEVRINVIEIKKPEMDAKLVADNIAAQLEKRVSFRRAMKKAIAGALKSGALGIRVNCSGRLGGAEIARMEWYREGRVPLHTLRADIDYSQSSAYTTYGVCGIKVWIFKGEVLNKYNWLKKATVKSN